MEKKITWHLALPLGATVLAFLAVGGGGAAATYHNLYTTLGSTSEAASVVLAGEGAVLVASLVCISLAMLGQSTPALARVALWLLPLAGSGAGAYLASTPKDRVVFALSPVAMAVAAEGLNLVARRAVTYLVGRDVNADSRNAALVAAITFHQGRSERHPGKWVKWYSKRRVWHLAGKLTVTDPQLVAGLAEVQSQRLTAGADVALSALLGGGVAPVALPAAPPVAEPVAEEDEPPHVDYPALFKARGWKVVDPSETTLPDGWGPLPPVTEEDWDTARAAVQQRNMEQVQHAQAAVAEAVAVVAADDTVKLLTAAEVAEMKGLKSTATVRSWVSRGKLTPRGTDERGRSLFHPIDVMDL